MNYTQLSTDYKYRHLANAIYAREMEYFHYDFDRTNFEYLVANLPPSPFRDDVESRHKETLEQIKSVKAIMAALWAQVDDQDAYAEAVAHVTREREEKDAEK